MMSDSLFAEAGWLFFALWSIAVATVTITAFGRDLLPSKSPAGSALPANSGARIQTTSSANLDPCRYVTTLDA